MMPAIRHPAWPNQEFFVFELSSSSDGRWFARGSPADSREEWQSLVRREGGMNVLAQIRPEQAATILIRAGFKLPSDLAAMVQASATGRDVPGTPEPRAEAAAGEVRGKATVAPPPEGGQTTDPLTESLGLIPHATHAPNLIKFLHRESNRTAEIAKICKEIYKSQSKGSLAKTRLLIKRTRLKLEHLDAPLRIVCDARATEAKLIDR
jgi:hypothetical protein